MIEATEERKCVLALGSTPEFLAWIQTAASDQVVNQCSSLGLLMRHLVESRVGLVAVHLGDPAITPSKAVKLILEVNADLPVVGLGSVDERRRQSLLAEGMRWCVPLTAEASEMATGLRRLQHEAERQDESKRAATGLYSQLKRHDRWAHQAAKSLRVLQHELRTPASIIQGFCANLLGGFHGELQDETRMVVERMANAANHLVELVTGPQAKVPPPPKSNVENLPDPRQARRQRTNADDTCRKVAGLFTDKAELHQVALELEVSGDCPPFWGYRTRISQALINLVDNAFRFTPRGGRITLRATKTFTPKGPAVAFEVGDTGSGIPADHIGHVFEEGWTTGRDQGNSGTGLAICQQVAEEHVADLTVTSEPGQGTTFRLTVPVDPRARARPTTVAQIDDPVLVGQLLAELSTRTTRPLNVERDEDMEQLAERILDVGGTVAVCADNSQELRAAVARLADHTVPKMETD